MRLNRYIAQTGFCSRRKADEYITSNQVEINGQVITDFSYQVSEADEISIDGRILKQNSEFTYIILRKPTETISSVTDTHGRKTVTDLIKTDQRIYPVGRLDFNTTGVLLLSNDGDFTNALIHPRNHVEKEYFVEIDRILTSLELKHLQEGVELDDGYRTRPCEIHRIERLKNRHMTFILILKEGKKRQVRRMIQALNAKVVKLDRILFAGLSYAGLEEGEYRALTEAEVKSLKEKTVSK